MPLTPIMFGIFSIDSPYAGRAFFDDLRGTCCMAIVWMWTRSHYHGAISDFVSPISSCTFWRLTVIIHNAKHFY